MLDKDEAGSTSLALDIYEKYLIPQVFEGDNYIMNGDIVTGYLSLQCQREDYEGAIRTKRKFIEFLKKEGTIDH